MSEAGTKVMNAIRHKFNMDDPKDVEAWDLLGEINKTPFKNLLKEFYEALKDDLIAIEKQIEVIEKVRLKNLKNAERRKQCNDILKTLREERDDLKRSIESEAYKRVAGGSREGTLRTRR